MSRKLYVSIPEYWEYANGAAATTVLPPQNYDDLIERIGRKGGFWCVKTVDKYSGEVLVEQWLENCLTDNGALAALKGLAGSAITAVTPANIMAIDQSLGYCALTSSISSGGTVASITVGALTGPTIPQNAVILIGAGGSTTLLAKVSQTGGITGAGTYTVTNTSGGALAGPSATIGAGANVRYDYSGVSTADVTALSAPVSYTAALSSGYFTYSPSSSTGANTGAGNRYVQVTNAPSNVFSTTGSPAATAANYTSAWLVNANPVAAYANCFVHVVFDAPVAVSSSSNGQVTITEKI